MEDRQGGIAFRMRKCMIILKQFKNNCNSMGSQEILLTRILNHLNKLIIYYGKNGNKEAV